MNLCPLATDILCCSIDLYLYFISFLHTEIAHITVLLYGRRGHVYLDRPILLLYQPKHHTVLVVVVFSWICESNWHALPYAHTKPVIIRASILYRITKKVLWRFKRRHIDNIFYSQNRTGGNHWPSLAIAERCDLCNDINEKRLDIMFIALYAQ